MATRTSTNNSSNKYLNGYVFWERNAFWRNGLYSKSSQEYFENWLAELRANERVLTRLSK